MTNQISKKNFNTPNNSSEKEQLITIHGARVHNLKNIHLEIPKNKLIVITGVSGSGKSSLSMDTLFAEGQRRYVESLSAYARQFLVRMNKPDVDYIKGLCPAIAIEQKVSTRSSRSTVGSLTELFDYLRLLYARIGKTISPVSGAEVEKHEVNDVVDAALKISNETSFYILSPIIPSSKRTLEEELTTLSQKGFSRILYQGDVVKIDELLTRSKLKKTSCYLVVDRLIRNNGDDDQASRIADSVQSAFYEGEGTCILFVNGQLLSFSNRFEADGISFEIPSPQFFNFNSPYGACKHCEGFGSVLGIDEHLVIPDKNLSVYEGAISCWKGEAGREWWHNLLRNASKFDFPIHRSYVDLSEEERQILWNGNEYFDGIHKFFDYVEKQTYKIQYRVMLSRYRGKTVCPDCQGSRMRRDADYVKLQGVSISELTGWPIEQVKSFFDSLQLKPFEKEVAKRILLEINNRLQFMCDVGLGYLTLHRSSSTLSGGETQRINLTRTLGSNLTSSLYILDEPSIGLHPKDTGRLITVLKRLRDLGNTVLVVEHEEEIMKQADFIIDMGPEAGIHGGQVIATGSFDALCHHAESLTGAYLSKREQIPVPITRRQSHSYISLEGCQQNNLKNIDVRFPLNTITVVTGVSGSGKTTLVKQLLYPALKKLTGNTTESTGLFRQLGGDYKSIAQVEMIDQNPLGKSSRSNPVTYIKAYDAIRELFSNQTIARRNGLLPKHFSFNVEAGRCEACKGDGEVIVEMQFLADVHLTCESCKGKRFKDEVLDVTYKNKNIFDVLELSVNEAIDFFSEEISIADSLKPLQDVGLGYIRLGQSSSTLSGGEAQRVKLASFLGKGSGTSPIVFIFDEPTTGLHFNDIHKLLRTFTALIQKGHSVIIIEHNVDVIKCADYVIDLGPEGGERGGHLVFQGTPEELITQKESYTASYLKEKLPT